MKLFLLLSILIISAFSSLNNPAWTQGTKVAQSTMDFEESLRTKLMKALKPTGTAQSIYAAIQIDNSGKILGLKVKGKPAQVAAEAQVTKLLVSGNPFMPLPKLYQSKKNIWMSFSWGSTGTSISGPYFSSESLPQWLLETVGLSVPTTRTRVRARAASTDYRDSSEAFAVYATTFISQGSEIGAEQMEMRPISPNLLPAGAVQSPAAALGMVAVCSINQGSMITKEVLGPRRPNNYRRRR